MFVVHVLEVEELAIQCPNYDKHHNHYKIEVTHWRGFPAALIGLITMATE